MNQTLFCCFNCFVPMFNCTPTLYTIFKLFVLFKYFKQFSLWYFLEQIPGCKPGSLLSFTIKWGFFSSTWHFNCYKPQGLVDTFYFALWNVAYNLVCLLNQKSYSDTDLSTILLVRPVATPHILSNSQ